MLARAASNMAALMAVKLGKKNFVVDSGFLIEIVKQIVCEIHRYRYRDEKSNWKRRYDILPVRIEFKSRALFIGG